jgi:hypothetical protein
MLEIGDWFPSLGLMSCEKVNEEGNVCERRSAITKLFTWFHFFNLNNCTLNITFYMHTATEAHAIISEYSTATTTDCHTCYINSARSKFRNFQR